MSSALQKAFKLAYKNYKLSKQLEGYPIKKGINFYQ